MPTAYTCSNEFFCCCKLFVKYCLIVITVYGNKQVKKIITIYAPMIYTAPCVRFWIWADRLRGEVGGEGLALEIESFVGPVKLHEPLNC